MSSEDSLTTRRLKKRLMTPPLPRDSLVREHELHVSESKMQNAFDLLQGYSRPESAKPARAGRLEEKSEFIQGEAEESDDDALAGFGILKPVEDEEDSDDENQDQTLAELVDDTALDEKTLAADAVLEKVR